MKNKLKSTLIALYFLIHRFPFNHSFSGNINLIIIVLWFNDLILCYFHATSIYLYRVTIWKITKRIKNRGESLLFSYHFMFFSAAKAINKQTYQVFFHSIIKYVGICGSKYRTYMYAFSCHMTVFNHVKNGK